MCLYTVAIKLDLALVQTMWAFAQMVTYSKKLEAI